MDFYPNAKNIRKRRPSQLLHAFQDVVEATVRFTRANPNFCEMLRYKRLFFLRSEYRNIIWHKLMHL